ncbi:alpha/beta hydrolase [Variovorax sp. J2P1-59]|uniref:alpha/beta fold hydrolase n=1 Tax=Variovorax flavidus TaxID=3053501 RepID=UPI0025769C89|nr:alpha/beta hydrolase [Variovorax sp. J2P1-59]MDM0075599.1 alpha/beta hydrolase [Variovorax sp. J2P1-59]
MNTGTFAKRCAGALAIALASLAPGGLMAQTRSFVLLEPAAQGSPTYLLGSEADLAAFPKWTDLESRTRQLADMDRGSFTGAEGKKIHYRVYRNRAETRGGIVIVSGRTEGLPLYQEIIYDLVRNGYSVYIHDHRGQGFSQRLVSSDPTMGYIDDFDNYVKDLSAFINGPVRNARSSGDKPLFLVAHSMGGAVTALYLEGTPDSSIKAAALVTPMMEPWAAGDPSPSIVAKLADAFCDSFSRKIGMFTLLSTVYAQGTEFDKQYDEFHVAAPDKENGISQSRVRYERNWETRKTAECSGADCGSTHAKVGGASYRWFNQSCNASEQARGESAANIKVPVLLLQGENDKAVKPSAQKEFCDSLNKAHGSGYCVGRTIPEAQHAVLIEKDSYRNPALSRVLQFLDCVRSGTARCE